MPYQKILVPTDGSEFTKPAIDKAVELAKITGAKITALYVVDHTLFTNQNMNNSVSTVYDMMKAEGSLATEYVRTFGAENGVEVEEMIRDGSPASAIVEASSGYDMIVMGTLGRTGFAKFMMGSVAERVIRYAKCPVLVVRSLEADNK